jgi:hypothetical protein
MQDIKTFADFASRFDLVLFNECVNLADGRVLEEYLENHSCEFENARMEIDTLKENGKENSKKCKELIDEYGDCPECSCEPYQWYAISINEYDVEYYNEEYALDIFYSDTLGIYILPVYHYGTAWDYVPLNKVTK